MENLYAKPAHAVLRAAFDDMWVDYKDCAAHTCQVPMPDRFAADPNTLADLTTRYQAGIETIYGS